jgi:hypothetical protein
MSMPRWFANQKIYCNGPANQPGTLTVALDPRLTFSLSAPAPVEELVGAVQREMVDFAPRNADILELPILQSVQDGSQPRAPTPLSKSFPTPVQEVGGIRSARLEFLEIDIVCHWQLLLRSGAQLPTS